MSWVKVVFWSACACLCAAFLYHTVLHITQNTLSNGEGEKPHPLLIDPGHGGQDGGTKTADGVLEDDINLSISLALRDMLTFCGYTVDMTRKEDASIQHADDTVSGSWKVRDMYNRLEMYDAAALTISIHQNHFSQSQYHGTQLFYSKNCAESQGVAQCIREQVVRLIQPQNTRELKPAGENIFLLHRTTKPALIVECGFLSNPDEAKKLQTPLYQQQMAFAICCGVLQYAS